MAKAEKPEASAAASHDRITLLEPYVDNGMRERPANTVVIMGYGAGEIDPARADYLIDEGLAFAGDALADIGDDEESGPADKSEA